MCSVFLIVKLNVYEGSFFFLSRVLLLGGEIPVQRLFFFSFFFYGVYLRCIYIRAMIIIIIYIFFLFCFVS